MYTSLVWIALSGSVGSSAALPTELAWQSDYSTARKRGAEEQKPLAVVVGRGSSGWENLSREGRLNPEVRELLQAHYVCVYIDVDSESGKDLASAFEMRAGLVLSDRSGDKQAFRHEGALTNDELEKNLRRYATPDRVVTQTETLMTRESRYYSPGNAPAYYPYSGPVLHSAGRSC